MSESRGGPGASPIHASGYPGCGVCSCLLSWWLPPGFTLGSLNYPPRDGSKCNVMNLKMYDYL